MAGPGLLQSDVDRRLAVDDVRTLIDRAEILLAEGSLQSAVLQAMQVSKKLADLVESMLDRNSAP